MTQTQRKIGLITVKYMPTILALTCALKIWLNVESSVIKDNWLYAVNWINVFLNIVMLAGIYYLGRCFGYCWKHRSLCRVAGFGYVYYMYFLLSHTPKEHIMHITYLYVATVIVLTLLYKEVR